MSIKPFLLLFLPYLIVCRQFRALLTSCATAGGCFAVGLLVFGLDAHWSWVTTLAASNWAWAGMNASLLGLLTRAFAENPHFAPLTVAPGLIKPLWLLSAGLVGVVTLLAATADASETAADRGFALLLLGAQLIGPLGWIYYLWLPLGPLTALTTSWWSGGGASRDATAQCARRWRTGLLWGAVPGLVWPLQAVMLFQPHPMATLLLGSLYFWATFGLWSSLIVDWLYGARSRCKTATDTNPWASCFAAKGAGGC